LLYSVRVTRETDPEVIDKLQRRKLELEVEIVGLEREKDAASKERLQQIRKAVADVEEQLRPLKAAYESEQTRNREINEVRKKIDELKAKADDAERRYPCIGCITIIY
jgi:ATP-dependent Clp protease ATP-binding subunit ClpB